jgi:predicted ester cyclase
MSTEENKALIRRYFAAIDRACARGDADVVDEFLAPDFVEHNPFPGLPTTRDHWKQAFRAFVAGAPGYHVIEDLIAEGDKVVGRVTAYGKHEGELFGIPRTGKDIRVTGIAVWRIADGKITEHWHETDGLGLMQQLGVIPSPAGHAGARERDAATPPPR